MASKNLPKPAKGFNIRKFSVIALLLITVGAGIVLISRASIPIYTTSWDFWGPRIRGCESGSGYAGAPIYIAQNSTSTASGAYQFLDSTWANYKGFEKARLAPAEVQEEKAFETFMRRGTQPWNASYACWRVAEADVPIETLLDDKTPAVGLAPLLPGTPGIAEDAKKIHYVDTPPADGLDPWVASPVVQFLRIFGLFRK